MKYSLIALLIASIAFSCTSAKKTEASAKKTNTSAIYSYSINDIDNRPINLLDFKGKKILFVNVASECGYTPQYAELQKLHETYNESLVIIGLPCNQFGEQEPGTKDEIKSFCQKNYGVEFLLTEKIDVKGENQHAIYKWLTSKPVNGTEGSSVKWNFTKFLVSESGELIGMFSSNVKPLSAEITDKI